jgi:H+-translocating NAD(P) transhydrogenase subunit beta
MLTMMPQFTLGATGLMAVFLLMSALAMLIIMLASVFFVLSVTSSGTSSTIDGGLGVFAFVVKKLWMTSMLPMVALYNGIGGGAVGAIAALELVGDRAEGMTRLVVTLLGALIGTVSLSASLIAWTRLNGVISRPLRVAGQRACIGLVVATALVVGGYIVVSAQGSADRLIAAPGLIYLLLGCALLFGALMTLPIGGAQMPAVISIYNAVTGLAVGLEGFVLRSPTLMIAGVAIGTARMLLTLRMAKR